MSGKDCFKLKVFSIEIQKAILIKKKKKKSKRGCSVANDKILLNLY